MSAGATPQEQAKSSLIGSIARRRSRSLDAAGPRGKSRRMAKKQSRELSPGLQNEPRFTRRPGTAPALRTLEKYGAIASGRILGHYLGPNLHHAGFGPHFREAISVA
jgi:hypothetical protein